MSHFAWAKVLRPKNVAIKQFQIIYCSFLASKLDHNFPVLTPSHSAPQPSLNASVVSTMEASL